MACPSGAITACSRELGSIVRGRSVLVELVYGRLRVGEAMSPPLINQVKKYADPGGLTIIDAPPGTSCPVITTLRDSDYVILVTEPTPFGLNDLKLAVETVRTLGIPFGIIINRCDVGDRRTIAYAETEGIEVLMEIPDRRDIAEQYSRGMVMTRAFPEMKGTFQFLYQHIEGLMPPLHRTLENGVPTPRL